MLNLLTGRIDRIRETSIIIIVVLFSAAGLWVGAQLWIDDALTSRFGIQALNDELGIVAVVRENSYLALSVANQIFSILLWFVYATVYKDRKFLIGATLMEAVDTFSDIWHKTGQGQLIANAWYDPTPFTLLSLVGALLLTLMYYTVGANLFLVVSITVFFETIRDGIEQSALFVGDILGGLISFWFTVWGSITDAWQERGDLRNERGAR